MKIRIAIIAIIAVCAGTFALTQAEPAQADGCRFQYGHGYSANCLPKNQKQKVLPRTTQPSKSTNSHISDQASGGAMQPISDQAQGGSLSKKKN